MIFLDFYFRMSFYKIKIIIDFTIYTLIKFFKLNFHVIFIVLFGAYKICFLKFKCGLDIILLNINKIYLSVKKI